MFHSLVFVCSTSSLVDFVIMPYKQVASSQPKDLRTRIFTRNSGQGRTISLGIAQCLELASKGVPSIQGTTTAASNRSASASVSVASMEDSRGGLAHLVGEMDAELRVEINSRLRLLTADLKGEIMSEVATRLSSAEASVSGIEAKLSSELDHVCEDFKVCLESITKARLVPRLKQLEDQMQSTKLLVATMEAHARNSKPESPQSQEHKEKDPVRRHSLQHSERSQETKEEEQAKHFISNGLRQRLHGLVSALSWTLGQVHEAETTGEIEGSHTGSGKTPGSAGISARRASDASANPPQRSRISASGPSLRPNGAVAPGPATGRATTGAGEPSPDAAPPLTQSQDFGKPVNRQASLHVAPAGSSPACQQPFRSPPSNGRTMTPQPHSMQAPAYPGMHWQGDPRTNSMAQPMQGRRPINSMPASRGGSPPLQQRNSMPRPHGMSASASPFQAPAHRSPQLVLSQRPAAQIQYRRGRSLRSFKESDFEIRGLNQPNSAAFSTQFSPGAASSAYTKTIYRGFEEPEILTPTSLPATPTCDFDSPGYEDEPETPALEVDDEGLYAWEDEQVRSGHPPSGLIDLRMLRAHQMGSALSFEQNTPTCETDEEEEEDMPPSSASAQQMVKHEEPDEDQPPAAESSKRTVLGQAKTEPALEIPKAEASESSGARPSQEVTGPAEEELPPWQRRQRRRLEE
eukprot:s602_g5.t2